MNLAAVNCLVLSLFVHQSPRAVTLTEALDEAERAHPGLAAARARVAAAHTEASVPRGLWLPRVTAVAQLLGGTTNNTTTSYLGTAGIDLPRISGTRVGELSAAPAPSTLVGLTARQELFDFGRISALSAAADAVARVEEQRAVIDRLDVRLFVKEAFYAVATAQALLRSAVDAEQRARVHFELSVAGVRTGLRPAVELTRAEAELARAEVSHQRADGALAAAQTVLAAAVGSSAPLLDVADAAALDTPLEALDQTLVKAEQQSAEVRRAQLTLESQQARTRAVGALLSPNLELSATVQSSAGGGLPTSGAPPYASGWLPVVPNWDLGVVLSWPLLDVAVLRSRDASAQQEATRAAELEVVRLGLRSAVVGAYVAAQTAKQTLPASERALAAARANFAQADARTRGGLGNQVELADAEALLTDAEIQLAVAHFDLARAQARLLRFTGEDP